MTHPTATIDGDLRLLGAGTTLGHPLGPLWIALDVDAMDVTNGAVDGGYVTGDLRARVSVGAVQMELWGTGQRNPLETEWGYGASAAWAPVPAAILQLFAGRTVTDPVYGTEGSFSAGLAVSWRLARHDAPPPLVARPGEWTGEGRRVQFRIVAPGAETVELVGDFSGWEP
ncbi:MAG: hypothetical protein GWM90_26960, partial [Gemmatimonadetes bacterium]|nr:hypothetical protein [Gemmatimonadota bacterium]NIQ52656.1 hypothetical protein [Gemmatimonadota bacterium]NIU72788.1 hypothetical protein [Gammaproteobacteria bacterium]NIX47575.1 hypothetical protein [Gemmatimonadota bacterium]